MQELCFEITEEMEDERVDKCLSALIDSLSRSYIQRMVKEGQVTVNGETVKGSFRVREGDRIVFMLPDAAKPDIEPEDIALDILYEDADVIVVNKPKGMVVHPAAGHYSGTLVNALMYRLGDQLSGIGGVMRPGIVHRIDMNTTGSVIVRPPVHCCAAEGAFRYQMLSRRLRWRIEGGGGRYRQTYRQTPHGPKEDGRKHAQRQARRDTLQGAQAFCGPYLYRMPP